MRKVNRSVPAHHRRRLRVVRGLGTSAHIPIGIIIIAGPKPIRGGNSVAAWISRGNARIIRDALDRALREG